MVAGPGTGEGGKGKARDGHRQGLRSVKSAAAGGRKLQTKCARPDPGLPIP